MLRRYGIAVEVLAGPADLLSLTEMGRAWSPGEQERPARFLTRAGLQLLVARPELRAQGLLVLHAGPVEVGTVGELNKAVEQLDLFKRPVQVRAHVRDGALVAPYLALRAQVADVPAPPDARPNSSELLPLSAYDHIIIPFSGGKDSLAVALEMIERCDAEGVPRSKLELWHHCVDGEPGSDDFMDWPVTADYCRAVARELGLPLRFQWREGGFRQELMKEEGRLAPARFELADGTVGTAGGETGKIATRRMFPMPTKNLAIRWCSAVLKIDVAARALANDPRFKGEDVKVLVAMGERRQEGGGRKFYAEVERHKATSSSRRVDVYRPVIGWNEAKVWAKIAEWGIRPHPVYSAGYSRCSCATCIFHEGDEWATIKIIAPERFAEIAALEEEFRKTINPDKKTVGQQADEGTPLAPAEVLAEVGPVLMSREYQGLVKVHPAEWELPRGAFTGGHGPM